MPSIPVIEKELSIDEIEKAMRNSAMPINRVDEMGKNMQRLYLQFHSKIMKGVQIIKKVGKSTFIFQMLSDTLVAIVKYKEGETFNFKYQISY